MVKKTAHRSADRCAVFLIPMRQYICFLPITNGTAKLSHQTRKIELQRYYIIIVRINTYKIQKVMKKIILIAIVLFSISGMGSCTNKEGDTEFETLTPKDPTEQTSAIDIDTVTVQSNTLNVKKL